MNTKSTYSHLCLVAMALALAVSVPLCAQSDPVYKFFQGRVKSCNEQCYRAKGREGYIDKTVHARPANTGRDFEIQYDSLGKMLRKSEFDIDGQIIHREHYYTYDGHNQLAEIRTLDKFGTIINTTHYWNTVDSSGKLLGRYVNFTDGSDPEGYTYAYSPNGTAVEYLHPKSGFPQKQLILREYDSRRNLTKYWSYTQKGKFTGCAVLTYDSLGNKIREALYDKDSVNYLNYEWKFDGNHNPLRLDICKPNSTSCESWIYKYEFDKAGNWVRRTEYRNGKLIYLRERKFTYW